MIRMDKSTGKKRVNNYIKFERISLSVSRFTFTILLQLIGACKIYWLPGASASELRVALADLEGVIV